MLNMTGHHGLYTATTTDKRSAAWLRRHCPDALQLSNGAVAIEGSGNAERIACEAHIAGHRVNVNGNRILSVTRRE